MGAPSYGVAYRLNPLHDHQLSRTWAVTRIAATRNIALPRSSLHSREHLVRAMSEVLTPWRPRYGVKSRHSPNCHGPRGLPMGESTRLPGVVRRRVEGVDHQRRLATSPFPGDTGAAAAETRRLIAAAAAEGTTTAYLRAVAALCGDRLLVPVVATTTRLGQTVGGLASDKEAEMSLVTLQAPDGRRALLAFSGLDALQMWRPDARPVAVTLDVAAQSARNEDLTAVVVDVAGPQALVIEGKILSELAAGHRLAEVADGDFGWVIPARD